MGEDFITASMYWRSDYEPSFQIGVDALKRLTEAELERWQYDTYGEGYFEEDDDGHLTPSGINEAINTLIGDLGEIFDMMKMKRRDATILRVGPYQVVIAGGMTDGDDPSDAFSAINRMECLPIVVLQRMGFDPTFDNSHSTINQLILESFI